LDKEVVHGGMPKRFENARIALLNCPLEVEKPEFDAKLNINNPSQMRRFLDEENNMLKSMVDKIASAGANVVLCQKGIDDMAQHYLARGGMIAVRRIKESDMSKLAKATGATLITNIDEITSSDLGNAQLVEERHVETDKWVFIEGCKNPKAISILLRGGSQRVVDEVERSVHDALMTVKGVVEYPWLLWIYNLNRKLTCPRFFCLNESEPSVGAEDHNTLKSNILLDSNNGSKTELQP
jgi:chaperonin GroEL (HSP60 family)